jgi:hypothetical protein
MAAKRHLTFNLVYCQVSRRWRRLSEGCACQRPLLRGTRACRVRFSEGPACRVRCATLDYPFRFSGHDKHAPPNSFAHASIVRRDALVGSARWYHFLQLHQRNDCG